MKGRKREGGGERSFKLQLRSREEENKAENISDLQPQTVGWLFGKTRLVEYVRKYPKTIIQAWYSP